MGKRIITISREFGSGGRSIAKMVAMELGIGYYDKEIIEKVSQETGYAKEFVEDRGEDAPSKGFFAYSFIGRDVSGMSVEDHLWHAQSKVIKDLAAKENCVIVGRCADFILRDRTDVLNVFIHASMDKRAHRIVTRYGETAQDPVKRLINKDKTRRLNYKYYTDQDWGRSQNYHICLDSGELGIKKCVELISLLAKSI